MIMLPTCDNDGGQSWLWCSKISNTYLGNMQPGEGGALFWDEWEVMLRRWLLSERRSTDDIKVVPLHWTDYGLCLIHKKLKYLYLTPLTSHRAVINTGLANISLLPSQNGFPITPMAPESNMTYLTNAIWACSPCSWCRILFCDFSSPLMSETLRSLWTSQARNHPVPKCCRILHQTHIKVKVVFIKRGIQSVGPLKALYTFCLPWQTCSFRHQLGFSGKHSSDAAITRKD